MISDGKNAPERIHKKQKATYNKAGGNRKSAAGVLLPAFLSVKTPVFPAAFYIDTGAAAAAKRRRLSFT